MGLWIVCGLLTNLVDCTCIFPQIALQLFKDKITSESMFAVRSYDEVVLIAMSLDTLTRPGHIPHVSRKRKNIKVLCTRENRLESSLSFLPLFRLLPIHDRSSCFVHFTCNLGRSCRKPNPKSESKQPFPTLCTTQRIRTYSFCTHPTRTTRTYSYSFFRFTRIYSRSYCSSTSYPSISNEPRFRSRRR